MVYESYTVARYQFSFGTNLRAASDSVRHLRQDASLTEGRLLSLVRQSESGSLIKAQLCAWLG